MKYVFQLVLNLECKNQNDSTKVKTIAPATIFYSLQYCCVWIYNCTESFWYLRCIKPKYQFDGIFITQKKQCGKQNFSGYTNQTEGRSSLGARFTERTDNWWEKMLTLDVADSCWRKKNMTVSAFKLWPCLN